MLNEENKERMIVERKRGPCRDAPVEPLKRRRLIFRLVKVHHADSAETVERFVSKHISLGQAEKPQGRGKNKNGYKNILSI